GNWNGDTDERRTWRENGGSSEVPVRWAILHDLRPRDVPRNFIVKNRMRILMLAAASSVHVVRWANAFVRRGHEVHLASQHPAAEGLSDQVVLHVLPHFRGAGYFLNGRKIKQLVTEIRPDVVNVHYASGYGTLSRAVHGPPLVMNVWGSDVFEFP